jgi:amino acid transporter
MVGPVSLAASMISIVIGAGIFVVPAQLSQTMGALAPLAFLGCAAVVGAVGLCLAESGSRVPSSGGIYAVVETAFGRCAGYVVGLLLLLSNLLACAAVTSALAEAVATVIPAGVRGAVHGAVIVGIPAFIAALNTRGIGV